MCAASASLRSGRWASAVRNALEFLEMCVVVPHPSRQFFEATGENTRIGIRSDGQAGARAAQDEGAVGELELQLPRLQHPSVLVGQDGEEHLVPELGLGW
jgi:hypothetical protein